MAACKRTRFFPKGTSLSGIIDQKCDRSHEINEDVELKCGKSFSFPPVCVEDHKWICPNCSKNIPSGNTLQRTPAGHDHDHTTCKTLLSYEINDPMKFKYCTHNAIKKITTTCGSSITGNNCSNKEHIILCKNCFDLTTTTSTPKIDLSDEKSINAAEEKIRNKTLDDLVDTHKKVKALIDDDDKPDDIINNDNCINRKHEFELRTKRILAAPARKFLQAYDTFMMQFDPNVFGDEIPKDLGDKLLKEVYDTYDIMEEARLKCLEVLTENDRMNNPKYDQYLRDRLAKKCECQRVHNEYFKINQNYQTLKPQTLSFDTPLKPQNAMPQFNHPKVPQPGGNLHKIIDQNMSHSQTFIPPIQRNPITSYSSERFPYFKMNEEILLVEKFNASKPRSYMAFRAQWQNFEAKMTKANRSELDKFYALLRVVDGQAKNLIHSEYPNNDSYREAINLLDKLFYEPSNLLRDMIKKLNRVNKMTDSYDSLLQGTISLRKAWLDLNQANLNIEQLKGLLFIATTEKQLSEGSWKIWLDVQNDARNDQDPNFSFDINHYMHAINLAMSNCCKRENAIGKSLQTENKFKPKSTLYGSYFTKPLNKEPTFKEGNTYKQANVNGKCVFCGYPVHKFQLYCPKLKKELKPDQIVKIMEKHDIKCYLCLGLNHRTKFCEAFKDGRLKRCSVIENKEKCNKLHCRFLHRYKNQPNSNLTTTPNELNDTESRNDSVQSQE